MKKWLRITLWIAGGFIFLIALALAWYQATYSMKVVHAYEINDSTFRHHVLIATQGSKFKDSIVSGVIQNLRSHPIYIKVIDVTSLSQVRIDEWDAIVVLHTWENWKAQKDAAEFLHRHGSSDKLVVVATSGAGSMKIEGVDAITSPSLLSEVSLISRRITDDVMAIVFSAPAVADRTE